MRGRLFTFCLIGISVVEYADGLCPLNPRALTLNSMVLCLKIFRRVDVHLVTVVTVVTSQSCKATSM